MINFQDEPGSTIITGNNEQEWTCKKCTLVNSPLSIACVVCGGSKLKSISAIEDMTLRKGEFWSCIQCTLKNSLSTNVCIACKASRPGPLILSHQQSNFRPHNSSPTITNNSITGISPNNSNYNTKTQTALHNRQILATLTTNNGISSNSHSSQQNSGNFSLVPPVNRISRSPSPKHDKSSGAVPKVCDIFL